MSRPLLAALALLITGQTPAPAPVDPPSGIVAQSLPPIAEPSWQFADQGTVYLVGKTTGKVVVIRGGTPGPAPAPVPDDKPKPPPVPDQITGVKWFSVIVDPNSPEQAAWRTNPALRDSIAKSGLQFRTYLSTETDIDTLGFRSTLGSTGTPCVILQDSSGKLVKSMSPQSLRDIVDLVELIK